MTDNRIYYSNQPLQPIQKPAAKTNANQATSQVTGGGFQQVFNQTLSGVKFSQHAAQRMQSRNINLDSGQMDQLQNAVDKAAQKGARESLILMNNELAFVVSVKNRTVITAMDGSSIKDNVFTNIDSAVIV